MTHKHTCLAAALLLALSPAAMAAKLALVGGTLVDGTLAEPIRDSVIIVDGERIVAVGTVASLPVPADAYKSFSVMGKPFDPADPDGYLASFAMRRS